MNKTSTILPSSSSSSTSSTCSNLSIPRSSNRIVSSSGALVATSTLRSTSQRLKNVQVKLISRNGLVILLSTLLGALNQSCKTVSPSTSNRLHSVHSEKNIRELNRLIRLKPRRPFYPKGRLERLHSTSTPSTSTLTTFPTRRNPPPLRNLSNGNLSSLTFSRSSTNSSSNTNSSYSSTSLGHSNPNPSHPNHSGTSSTWSSTHVDDSIASKLPFVNLATPSKVLLWWNDRIINNQKRQENEAKGKQRLRDSTIFSSSNSSKTSSLKSTPSHLHEHSPKTASLGSILNQDHKIDGSATSSGSIPCKNSDSTSSSNDEKLQTSSSTSDSNLSSSRSSSLNSSSSPSSSSSSSSSSDSSNSSNSSSNSSPSPPPPPHKGGKGTGRIHELMRHPALYSPIRAPRYPIVLCHGLYGFDVRGPFFGLEIHYWAATLDILRKKVGAEVIVRGVPGTGSIQARAESLHEYLCSPEAGVRGKRLNFAAHSMGGLDVRHLLSHIQPLPSEYIPMSLTTISTPHRGSPFMDWCNANVGVGNDLVEEAIIEEREGRNGAVLGERSRKFYEDRRKERERLSKTKSKKDGEKDSVQKFYSGVDLKDSVENEKGNEEKVKVVKEEDDDVPRPPYTLKTPLFVRPKNGKKQVEVDGKGKAKPEEKSKTRPSFNQDAIDSANKISQAGYDAIRDSVVNPDKSNAVKSTSTNSSNSKDEQSKSHSKAKDLVSSTEEKEKKSNKSNSSSLPFGFSTIASALSTLTGNFSSYMLSLLDQPAYAMLSTRYMSKVFNPRTPDVPSVKYYSIAARTRRLAIYHPLWLPKLVLDAAAESRSTGGESDGSAEALGSDMQGNDGLVNVQSAKWGEFLGVMEGCDHWDLRGSGGPRWKDDRLDPKTGRIREEHEEKERLKSERKDRKENEKLEKEKKKEENRKLKEEERERQRHNGDGGKSWIDINRLLGSWLSKSNNASDQKIKSNTVKDLRGEDSVKDSQKSTSLSTSASSSSSSSSSNSTDVATIAQNFLENYASLTSPDEGSQNLSRSSSSSTSSKSDSKSSSESDSTSSISSSGTGCGSELEAESEPESESLNFPSASSLIPTSLTATPIPDSKLIKEVASWISDRLPERDQERRDLAERRAEIQDRDGYGLRRGGVEGLGWREGYSNDDNLSSSSSSSIENGSNSNSDPNSDQNVQTFSMAGNSVGEWQGGDVAGIGVEIQIDENSNEKSRNEERKISSGNNLGLTLASLPSLQELDPPPGSISSPGPTTLSSLSGTVSIPTQSDNNNNTNNNNHVNDDRKEKIKEQDLSDLQSKPSNDSELDSETDPGSGSEKATAGSKRKLKLRRDVEWLEALGEGSQARELRRELSWHRAQHIELKSKDRQVQSSSSSSSSNSNFGNPTLTGDPDEPLILDVPDTPIKHPNIRKPSDRDDVYDWDVPNKRRRDLLSAMGIVDHRVHSSTSTSSSNLLTSTQSLASGSSINSREVSDRLGLGYGKELRNGNGGNAKEGMGMTSEKERETGSEGRKRRESEKQRRERELKEEEVELERFWLAICRHLWLEGM